MYTGLHEAKVIHKDYPHGAWAYYDLTHTNWNLTEILRNGDVIPMESMRLSIRAIPTWSVGLLRSYPHTNWNLTEI